MSDSIEGLRQQLQQFQEQYATGALPKESYDAENAALEQRLAQRNRSRP